jgi:hypothetical protein
LKSSAKKKLRTPALKVDKLKSLSQTDSFKNKMSLDRTSPGFFNLSLPYLSLMSAQKPTANLKKNFQTSNEKKKRRSFFELKY